MYTHTHIYVCVYVHVLIWSLMYETVYKTLMFNSIILFSKKESKFIKITFSAKVYYEPIWNYMGFAERLDMAFLSKGRAMHLIDGKRDKVSFNLISHFSKPICHF